MNFESVLIFIMIFIFLFAAVLGACIGSFCNVLIVRLHEGSSIGGRSRCVRCRKELRAQHLIPIISWVVLRARCAFCRAPIHWQYPAVETAGAVIGCISVVMSFQQGWRVGCLTAIFLFALLVVTAFDLRWQLVPVWFAGGAGIVIGVLNIALFGMSVAFSTISGSVVTAGILMLIVWISGGRLMGEGDPSIGFLIGAMLGWPLGPIALLLAFFIGGAVASVLLLTGKVGRKTPVPFVPFLTAGALMAYFWQGSLLQLLRYVLV